MDPAELGEQFGVLIADPPYSRRVHRNPVSTCSGKTGGVRSRDFGFAHLSPQLRRWLGRVAANVSRWSAIYSDLESATWLRISCQAAGAEYIRTVPWIRWSQPQLSGDRPLSGAEAIVLTHRRGGKKAWSGPGDLTEFQAYREKSLRGKEKFSAEKPLDLELRLVSYFTRPGDRVLSVCAGKGTTARACQILGRDCLAVELDPATALRARDRLASPLSTGELDRICRFVEEDRELATRLLEQSGTDPKLENSRRRCRDMLQACTTAAGWLP